MAMFSGLYTRKSEVYTTVANLDNVDVQWHLLQASVLRPKHEPTLTAPRLSGRHGDPTAVEEIERKTEFAVTSLFCHCEILYFIRNFIGVKTFLRLFHSRHVFTFFLFY